MKEVGHSGEGREKKPKKRERREVIERKNSRKGEEEVDFKLESS